MLSLLFHVVFKIGSSHIIVLLINHEFYSFLNHEFYELHEFGLRMAIIKAQQFVKFVKFVVVKILVITLIRRGGHNFSC